MQFLATQAKGKPQNGMETALERSARIAWILGLSLLGLGGVYFVALYFVAH